MSWGRQKLLHRWMLQQLGLEGASPPLTFHQTLLRFDEAKDKLGDTIVLSERLKAAILKARTKEQVSVEKNTARTEQRVDRHEHAREQEMSIEEAMKQRTMTRTSSEKIHPQRSMKIRKIVQATDDPEMVAYARKTWVKEDTIAWFARKADESGRLRRLQAQQRKRDELTTSEQAWAKLQEARAAVSGDQASKKAEKDEQATKQASEVADGVRKLFGI